jgi:hypothetical protein
MKLAAEGIVKSRGCIRVHVTMENKPTIYSQVVPVFWYETTGNDDIDAIVKKIRFPEVVSVSDLKMYKKMLDGIFCYKLPTDIFWQL